MGQPLFPGQSLGLKVTRVKKNGKQTNRLCHIILKEYPCFSLITPHKLCIKKGATLQNAESLPEITKNQRTQASR